MSMALRVVDQDGTAVTTEEEMLWEQVRGDLVGGIIAHVRAGDALRRLRAMVDDRAPGTWIVLSARETGYGYRYIQRLTKLSERVEQEGGVGMIMPTELARLWEEIMGLAPTLPALMASESPEWYTPPDLMEEIRAFLGEIDLDPCPPAHKVENRPDGLALTWKGRVFCNPPYGDGIGDWVNKAVEAGAAKRVTEAIFLVPARTDTDWFVPLWDWAICFIHGRLKFSRPDGTLGTSTFPSVLAYFGPREREFAAALAHRGVSVSAHVCRTAWGVKGVA